MSPRLLPAPLMNPEAQPWFDAAAGGHLLIRWCETCDRGHHPPRSICPHCLKTDTVWRTASGRGVVHSFSTLRRGVPEPYCIAYVTLDEGLTILTNLVDCDVEALTIGLAVTVRFVEAEGGVRIPVFGPEAR